MSGLGFLPQNSSVRQATDLAEPTSLDFPRAATIVTEPAIPVTITDATYAIVDGWVTGLKYTIVNNNQQGLVAYAVTFTVETEDGYHMPLSISADSYVGGHQVLPGATDSSSGLYSSWKPTKLIRSVKARITFAEFADGSLFGDMPEKSVQSLDKRRRQVLAVYADVLGSINQARDADKPAVLQNRISGLQAKPGGSPEREAAEYLIGLDYNAALTALRKSEAPPNR